MRKIETFTDADMAKMVKHCLTSAGIDCRLEAPDQNSHDLWIMDEDQMTAARKIISDCRQNPGAAQAKMQQQLSHKPARSVQERLKAMRAYRHRRGQIAYTPDRPSMTIGLIGICVVIFVLLQTGLMHGVLEYLFFSQFSYPLFVEIREGQIWRLVTPIFLHFNIWHIVFNMIWLYQLGVQIEYKQGPKILLLLVIVIGVLSNTIEYLVPPHNPFGGMSGVIYGLLGYIWTMGHFNPRSGYFMDNGTLWFMIIWLFLCMAGVFGPTANWCHLVGLVAGLSFGYVAAVRSSR